MRLPQTIRIEFTEIDESNWYEMEIQTEYECSNDEIIEYLEQAISGLEAVGE